MGNIKHPGKYADNIGRIVTKTIFKYDLISDGDKILVALSGGKDSMILLDTLAKRKKHMEIKYTLGAIHIDVENIPYHIDKKFLENHCRQLEVPLTFKTISVDLDSQSRKSPCFICSWHRRKALFQAVQEMNYDKLAFGHHMDDAVETLLMNMIHKGSISSIPPKLNMFENKFDIIRPLLMLSEEQLRNYADIMKFPKEKKDCPFDEQTMRHQTKELMEYLETMNENARKNIYRSMSKIFVYYLPYIHENAEKSIRYEKK